MKKVLIVSYYWPPSGGAGVQRWLKLSNYLAELGVQLFIVTVSEDKASYMQWDESLLNDVNPKVEVHKTDSFEPINYYARLVGKKNVPTAGFSNVNNKSWKQQLVNRIRSNFFIPDPRVGWKRFATKKAIELIKEHHIETVITTSPPHSTQLVGKSLKKAFPSLKWIVDFRDPWTDIYYYKLLGHSYISKTIDAKYEREIVEGADQIITAGQKFKDSFQSKTNIDISAKTVVIPNGYDPKDFEVKVSRNSRFTISYTGTMSDYYQPEVFFRALNKLIKNNPNVPIDFLFIGTTSANIKEIATNLLGSNVQFLPPVSHKAIVKYMQQSHLLLLVTQGTEGTIPGKTFEYLASERTIVCIGKGDAADIIAECSAGESFERSEEKAILAYLEQCLNYHQNNSWPIPNYDQIKKHSRPFQAEQVMKLIQ
jgi:glycosyltransferase involved in cell wall biosynthesis